MVSGTYGLEKLSHLEDKIYRAVEQFLRERKAREELELEVAKLRSELRRVAGEKDNLEAQVERLLDERDGIKQKVETMLEAIAVLETEEAEVGG